MVSVGDRPQLDGAGTVECAGAGERRACPVRGHVTSVHRQLPSEHGAVINTSSQRLTEEQEQKRVQQSRAEQSAGFFAMFYHASFGNAMGVVPLPWRRLHQPSVVI